MSCRPFLKGVAVVVDPKDIVRAGYDAISRRYRDDDGGSGLVGADYSGWLSALSARLAPGSTVLDLGCGNGVPVARELEAAGVAVTGVDFSEVQIARARELVPGADFRCADMASVEFADQRFDAVVCLYAVIHLLLAEQPALLTRIARWLRPGGWLLLTAGQTAWTGDEPDWLGAPMWWSHADADTYRGWLVDAGLVVAEQGFVAEGAGGHSLFRAQRPPPSR